MHLRKRLIPPVLFLGAASLAGAAASPPEERFSQPDYWKHVFTRDTCVDYPILFVHGIGTGFDDWRPTASALSGSTHWRMRYNGDGELVSNYLGGDPAPRNSIWNVSYYHDTPVKEAFGGNLTKYARRLERIVDAVKRITKRDKVVLICHSMGGLVARGYMARSDENWESVHKIVTVATPNEGVGTAVGVVGQLRDLRKGSEFITGLNTAWRRRIREGYAGWGVVGAVDIGEDADVAPEALRDETDSGGVGFIKFSSAIPFGEWKAAAGARFGEPARNTPHFGYRVAIRGEHKAILDSPAVFRAILWALSP